MTEPHETPIDASWEEMVEARNRPRSPQHALLMAVRAGEMTPKQAEEQCRADGVSLPHEGWKDRHDITANSIWWLPQAVLFYAWQDLGHTREQWERFSMWEDALWRDPTDERQSMSLDRAEVMFRSDLAAGLVRAFAASGDGPVRPIPCETWDTSSVQRWRGSAAIGDDGISRFVGAFVLRHEIVPLLISEHVVGSQALAEPVRRERVDQLATKRGGRPTTWDWDAMWIEVVRLMKDGEVPSRADLPKHLAAWFQATVGDEPASSTLRDKVKKLFDTIGID